MMATTPQAIASLTGIPASTMMGIRTPAPPSPVSEPKSPTHTDMLASDAMFNVYSLSGQEPTRLIRGMGKPL